MAWIKRNYLYVVALSLGCLLTDSIYKINTFYDELNCGNMRGHTTLITYDSGMLICIYRQDSFPFKTISGIKV